MQVAPVLPLNAPQSHLAVRGMSPSPTSLIRRSAMSPSPTHLRDAGWTSPCSRDASPSPSAIISEAKDWVSGSSRALRRPSLDGFQLPFDDTPSVRRRLVDNGFENEKMSAPRRLPSLTMEAFSAMKKRESMESRCSDPGVRSSSSRPRDDSKEARRFRRRQVERGDSGILSAPCSRGEQVAELMTPLHIPDAPLTEPHQKQGRDGFKVMKRNSSTGSISRYDAAPSSNARRTPSRSNQEPSQASSPYKSSEAPIAPRKGSGTTGKPPKRQGGYGGFLSPPALAPMAPLPIGRSRENSVGDVQESVSPIRRPDAPAPQRSRPTSAARMYERKEGSEVRTPSPPDQEPIAGDETTCLGAKIQTAALTISTAAATDASKLTDFPRRDEWDNEQEEEDSIGELSRIASSRSRSNGPHLSVSLGPKGITGLALAKHASGSIAPFGSSCINDSFVTPRPQGSSTSLDATLSSPDAIRGSAFSWVKGQVLGHGSMGSVYEGLDQRTGKIFAVKEVRIDRKLDTDLKFKESLESEISIYKELSHPHIVSYLGHDYIDSHLYIYLEYMQGGSVAQVLSQFGPFAEELIAEYALGLLEGLEYLHTRSPIVLHRDIKGANILVGDDQVKLSDFGCSKRTADTMSQSLRGSIPWMAPEVIQQTGYGRRSDVWSFGCVLIEMATARHPWGNFDNPMAAMMKIGMSNLTPDVPETLSEVCRDFIGECTRRDKNLRPLATELLQHEFVRNVRRTPD